MASTASKTLAVQAEVDEECRQRRHEHCKRRKHGKHGRHGKLGKHDKDAHGHLDSKAEAEAARHRKHHKHHAHHHQHRHSKGPLTDQKLQVGTLLYLAREGEGGREREAGVCAGVGGWWGGFTFDASG
ncbi:hypothetical protein J3R82DRAFT_7936 [Butyriboletus roseoflavus]|nr:hypothetical protein J3R82DRAFT_7936 [Butyriboletus roseoflavus]